MRLGTVGPLPGEEPASGRGDSGGLARRDGSHQDLERSARRISSVLAARLSVRSSWNITR